jgi:hypothetical protein
MMMWILWESVMKNINTSAKESLGHYELKSINHGSVKDVQNYSMKRKKPDCNGYRIQIK